MGAEMIEQVKECDFLDFGAGEEFGFLPMYEAKWMLR